MEERLAMGITAWLSAQRLLCYCCYRYSIIVRIACKLLSENWNYCPHEHVLEESIVIIQDPRLQVECCMSSIHTKERCKVIID